MIRQLKIKWKFMLVVFLTTMFPIVLIGHFSYLKISDSIMQLHNSAVINAADGWREMAKRYDQQVNLLWAREISLGEHRLVSMAQNLQLSAKELLKHHRDKSLEEQLNIWAGITSKVSLGDTGAILLVDSQMQILTMQGSVLIKPLPLEQRIAHDETLERIKQQMIQAQYGTCQAINVPMPDRTGLMQDHLVSVGYFEMFDAYTVCAQPVSAYKSQTLLTDIQQQFVDQTVEAKGHEGTLTWVFSPDNQLYMPANISEPILAKAMHLHASEPLKKVLHQIRDNQETQVIQKYMNLRDTASPNSPLIEHQMTLCYIPQWDWIICVASHMDCIHSAHAQLLHGVIIIGIITLVTSMIVAMFVARRMAKPVEELNEAAMQVTWGSLSVDLTHLTQRKDEYGELAHAFQEMAVGLKSKITLLQMSQEQMQLQNQELKDEIAQRRVAEEQKDKLHDQLLAASREAGMAEIASAVLHNVGNELNSINVSSALVNEQGKQSSLAHLFNIAEIMRPHVDNFADFVQSDPQGQLLPRALIELTDTIKPEYNFVMDEIGQLVSGIDRIKQIIQAQQSYVTHVDVNQPVEPAQIFEDALAINQAGIEQREIVIQKHFTPVPRVHLSKHKVLQILVNLISNAKHAMDQTTGKRQITLQMTIHKFEDEHQLIYRVVDTGCGIKADHLNRIFNHGFSTRNDGRGYGLHYSILTATELGGSLTVQSPGPGCGATFTLILPVKIEAQSYGPMSQTMDI